MWEISPRINSPKDDGPSLWEPLEPAKTDTHKDVYAVKAIGHTNLLSASGNTVAIAECRPTRTCLVKRRWREKNRGWDATAR